MPLTLTAFADEVSPYLDAQIAALVKHEIPGLDVRSLEGTNVLELELAQLEEIASVCADHGRFVSCVGSPVNKVPYNVLARAKELDRLKRACYAAARMNCKRIRLFTPEVPEAEHEAMTATMIDWVAEQKRVAVEHGLILVHENDGHYWGAYPENAKRLFRVLGDGHFRAAFDFANTVLIGFRPMTDWFPWLRPHLDTLHLKDAIEAEHRVVPVGEGDGDIEATLRYLFSEGWSGPLTIEPHLAAVSQFGGFSGPQLFEVAVNAVRKTVRAAGGDA